MLQSDLHHAIGFLCSRQAIVRFRNGPRHCFLSVQVFAGCESIQKIPTVDVERAGYDNSVDVFHIKHATVIIKCLNAWRHLFGFVPPLRVYICDGHQLTARHFHHLFEQFLPAAAYTDHPHTHPVIGAEHSRRWINKHCRCPQSTPLYEISPRVLRHFPPPRLTRSTLLQRFFHACPTLPRRFLRRARAAPVSLATYSEILALSFQRLELSGPH